MVPSACVIPAIINPPTASVCFKEMVGGSINAIIFKMQDECGRISVVSFAFVIINRIIFSTVQRFYILVPFGNSVWYLNIIQFCNLDFLLNCDCGWDGTIDEQSNQKSHLFLHNWQTDSRYRQGAAAWRLLPVVIPWRLKMFMRTCTWYGFPPNRSSEWCNLNLVYTIAAFYCLRATIIVFALFISVADPGKQGRFRMAVTWVYITKYSIPQSLLSLQCVC